MERAIEQGTTDIARHMSDQVSESIGLRTSSEYMQSESTEQKLMKRMIALLETIAAGKTGKDSIDHAETVHSPGWSYKLRQCEGVYVYTIVPEGYNGFRIIADTPMIGKRSITLQSGWTKMFLPINTTLRGGQDPTGAFADIAFTGDLVIRYSDTSPL